MLTYLKKSFQRKIARRYTKKYPHEIYRFQLDGNREIEFANWNNPLIAPKEITQPRVNFFKKFIPEGSLCIDIGANIGERTVSIALSAGKDGLVLAFDPNPYVFEILKVNAGLNKDLTNIKPFPFAITIEDGEFYYNSSEASMANGGISSEPNNRHGSFKLDEKIKGINLEKFLETNFKEWTSKLAIIKIDTEGYDKEILNSIFPIIEKYKPIIFAECFKKLTKDERDELYETIVKHGYELYYFEDFTEPTTIVKLKKEDMENGFKWSILMQNKK